MLRFVFLLLVFVNLAYFIWAGGYLGSSNEGHEPERLQAQLAVDRLKIIGREEPAPQAAEPAGASAAPPVLAAAATDDQSATRTAQVAGAPAVDTTPEAAPPAIVCRRAGPMSTADADKLTSVVTGKGGKVTPVAGEEKSYWVFIPAVAGKPMEASVAELKQAGISDFFVAGGEKGGASAISLGLFHQEAAAKELLQRLAKKGIRSAKIETKPRKTDKVLLDVQAPADVIDRHVAGASFRVTGCPKE